MHKPDILALAEPWTSLEKVETSYWEAFALHMVATNDRSSLAPNLCYPKSMEMWQDLSALLHQHMGPWMINGDFNAVRGTHEQHGQLPPNCTACDDYKIWTKNHQLLHIPTKGNAFTWTNGRKRDKKICMRLDRAICNGATLVQWTNIMFNTLVRSQSNHHSLLLSKSSMEVQRCGHFKFLDMWLSHPGCRSLVAETWATTVIGCPMAWLKAKLKLLKQWLRTCGGIWRCNSYGIGSMFSLAVNCSSPCLDLNVLPSTPHPPPLVHLRHHPHLCRAPGHVVLQDPLPRLQRRQQRRVVQELLHALDRLRRGGELRRRVSSFSATFDPAPLETVSFGADVAETVSFGTEVVALGFRNGCEGRGRGNLYHARCLRHLPSRSLPPPPPFAPSAMHATSPRTLCLRSASATSPHTSASDLPPPPPLALSASDLPLSPRLAPSASDLPPPPPLAPSASDLPPLPPLACSVMRATSAASPHAWSSEKIGFREYFTILIKYEV
ncbi:hypothetical protein Fmac_031551 [Flemingia macrophylla]|uniref:Uncharacterized protein n=1 Tax=Flemingia macrophylla TaxID=520843 RepID=A0ABD1L3Q9_9FABA